MSRNHLRVSAQANNERHESEIIREIMNKAHPDYARSEATTITEAPVKVRPTREIKLEAEISDLRKQLTNGMDTMDAQAERIAEQDTNIKGLYKALARIEQERFEERAKLESEIKALKALLKRYL